ncbi:MAG: tRNA (N6-threonylcarbamoyladenosine(37)-N6)-methyltransferase TrmO [Armatimonadetes bacterium]|nr:tRNA (N6-threonylcarbamoyladenosine(37)-N6)-methyltransferase TrmO [Armatimonadota bacterium]
MDLKLEMRPIGFARTGPQAKFGAPHQPDATTQEVNRIELLPNSRFELALQDLEGFDRIWLVWWFHRNESWRPRVLPPRGPAVRRGVFATRSPHRPNPIGLTCVQLFSVESLTLTVGPLDLVDGTPILDIKPYIPTIDAFPASSAGWVEALADEAPQFIVEFEPTAREQLDWLRLEFGVDFECRASSLLSKNPYPHRTRRIIQMPEGDYRIACGPWRMRYRIEGQQVLITTVYSGYALDALVAPGFDKISNREALLAFLSRYS